MSLSTMALGGWVLLQSAPFSTARAGGPSEAFLLPFSIKVLDASPGFLSTALRVYSVAVILASALALVLALRPRSVTAALLMARTLAGLAFFSGYFVLGRHVPLLAASHLLGVLDYVGMGALAFGLSGLVDVAYFYPQPIETEAFVAYLRKMQEGHAVSLGLRRFFEKLGMAPSSYKKLKLITDGGDASMVRFVRSGWWPMGLAILGSGLVALSQFFGPIKWVFLSGHTSLVALMFCVLPMTFGALEWQYRTGNAEDRARITWLFLGLVIFFWLWSVLWGGSMLWLLFSGSELAGRSFAIGLTLALPVAAIVLVLLLGCSIFFFGAIDPRMAIRKTSLYGIAALLLTVALAVAQSSVAHQIVGRIGLPGNSGTLVAGGLVALLFAPMRKRIEAGVERAVDRMLPASTLAEAYRETVTVVFGDLSGYTALSARDEPKALTLASLLHKESRRLAERHGGRLVKSIGDAVMLSFREPGEAVLACAELREQYAAAAAVLNLPVLPLHFGLHTGEVVRDRDGDIFGGVVNLAARLQGVAHAGEIVVSGSVASELQAGHFTLQSLGAKVLKNVPAPVNCFLVA